MPPTRSIFSVFSTIETIFSDEKTLLLEPDSPLNTTISDSETCKTLYTISTQKTAIAGKQKTVTRFQNADGEIIASSEWQMGAEEDVISILGHASALPFNAFFKKSFLPFNECVSGIFYVREL